MAVKRLGVVGVVVGVTAVLGALALTVGAHENQATDQLTVVATRQDLVADAVATGRVTAASTYALSFGRAPRLVPPAPMIGTLGETSAPTGLDGAGGGAGASAGWPTASVAVAVGEHVRKGQLLAQADQAEAKRQLAVAQADLKAAEARLAADLRGPSGSERAEAGASLSRAREQRDQALAAQRATAAENRSLVARASSAVAAASTRLAEDRATGASPEIIEADLAALDLARRTRQEALAHQRTSDAQAVALVRPARTAVAAAEKGYRQRVGPVSAAQIALDDARIARAQAVVTRAVEAVERGRLVAPADGTVVAVNLEPGVVTSAGDGIVMESAVLEARGTFPEADVASLDVGQAAQIGVPALGARLAGTVKSISPVAAPDPNGIAAYEVVVASSPGSASSAEAAPGDTDRGDWGSLRSGMTAELTVATGRAAEAITVPSIAIRGEHGAYSVEVVGARGAVEVRPVEVGLVTSSLAEIVSGVAEGEQVVVGVANPRQGGLSIGGSNPRPTPASR